MIYYTRAVASMRRTEALASVKFYQILSIFIFFIRLIILEDFIRLISYNGPCVRLGCSFFLATALYTLAYSFHSCLDYSRREGSNHGGSVWGRLLPLRYIGMWAWYLRCFGLRTGIDFVFFHVWNRI